MTRLPKIVLRRPAERDAAELIALNKASRALHRPWVSAPTAPAAYAQYLARQQQATHIGFLICCADDGAIAGVCNITEIVRGVFRSAYLGYYVGAPYAGRGYMRAGLARVLSHAFGPLGLHRLEANIRPGNVASRALVTRLGFRLEGYSPRYLKLGGRWRDHERWAILAEDWKPSRHR